MAGAILSYPITYRGLTLNEHRSTAGVLIPGVGESSTYRVDRFDFSRMQIRDQREGLHLGTGGDLGVATNVFRYLSIGGMVKDTTSAKLEDRIARLLQAFDIEAAQFDAASNEGIQSLRFWCPTEEVGYAPVVGERFRCRPAAYPAITNRLKQGHSALFALELVCADTRRYLDALTSVRFNDSNGWTQDVPNWGTDQDEGPGMPVYPTLTILMDGAGASGFEVVVSATGTTTRTLGLDLSGMANDDEVVVDCTTGQITKNGVKAANLRTTAVDTFPYIFRGGSSFAFDHIANVQRVDVDYRQARS